MWRGTRNKGFVTYGRPRKIFLANLTWMFLISKFLGVGLLIAGMLGNFGPWFFIITLLGAALLNLPLTIYSLIKLGTNKVYLFRDNCCQRIILVSMVLTMWLWSGTLLWWVAVISVLTEVLITIAEIHNYRKYTLAIIDVQGLMAQKAWCTMLIFFLAGKIFIREIVMVTAEELTSRAVFFLPMLQITFLLMTLLTFWYNGKNWPEQRAKRERQITFGITGKIKLIND